MHGSVRTILISRLMFNLREVFLTSEKISPCPTGQSTSTGVDFARSIFGNLAAPLMSSDDEFVGDEVEIQDTDSDIESMKSTEELDSICESLELSKASPSNSLRSIFSRRQSSVLGESEKGYFLDDDRIVVVDIRYA